MRFQEDGENLVILTPAKLNLFLEVLGKRSDGYHELETVMQEVSLWDRIDLRRGGRGIEVLCTGENVPSGRENIVFRAAEEFLLATGIEEGLRIAIRKRIPPGAGLGGGSGNAAGVLKGLNHVFSTGLTREELAQMGEKIGSDVPFFLYGGIALCRGRGEKVLPLFLPSPMHYLLVVPDMEISTRLIYENLSFTLTKNRRNSKILLNRFNTGELKLIGETFFNRLERVVEGVCPELENIKKKLEKLVNRSFSMTGSGSGLFCHFEKKKEAHREEEKLKEYGFRKTFLVTSLSEEEHAMGAERIRQWR